MKIRANKTKCGVVVGLLAATSLLLVGSASSADHVAASYVSPMLYQSNSCDQIGLEMTRVSARVGEMANAVNHNATGDAVKTAVGIVLFWPALFFIEGDVAEAAEYARLKGEFDALQQANIAKNCGLSVEPVRIPEGNSDLRQTVG